MFFLFFCEYINRTAMLQAQEKSMELKYSKRTMPWIPVGHPQFKWTAGADVQATWIKYGWTPPKEGQKEKQ